MWLLSALLGFSAAHAGDIDNIMGDAFEILEPDQAFTLSSEHLGDNRIAIRFVVEPGYYLYREKMAVALTQQDFTVVSLLTPEGKIKSDEFFGETETYRDAVELEVLYDAPTDAPLATLDLKVLYQGCADVGICYPPQEKILSVALPAQTASSDSLSATPVQKKPTVVNKLDSLLGSDDEELLPPDIAFVPSVGPQNDSKINLHFAIEDGYYLYKDKISASLVDEGGAMISEIALPKGEVQEDAFFGTVEVFRHTATATLSLANLKRAMDTQVAINYQGCADIGVCFPPQTSLLPVSLAALSDATDAPAIAVNESGNAAITKTPTSAEPTSAQQTQSQNSNAQSGAQTEQDRLAKTLSTNSIWIIILTFFGLGLLLAFTPCVFPMIPILSSIIVGQGTTLTTRKAFALSLTYVLAMAVTYTIAGVIVGLSGENIQIWFQTPWVLSVFAALFVLLSLSMFGFYELQMPQSIQLKLNSLSNNAEGGTFIGAGIMGFLSALIVGPCVTAPLVGALIFIANTGDALVGGTALFALSMGMGAPLLLIGASCGKLLPKTGAWMDATKAVFGVLLLALAIWMLSRIVPAQVTLALSAALLIVSGIYLGATDALSPSSSGWRRLFKGAGLVVLVYGLTLLIGALSGGHSLLQPLRGVTALQGEATSGEQTHAGELQFERVRSVSELQQKIKTASSNGQTVMLDFYADWCISCKEMEAFTFTDSDVQKRLKNTLLLQADVTANNDDDKALLKKFGLFGPPGIIFYSATGDELRDARMVGFMSAENFSNHLDQHL